MKDCSAFLVMRKYENWAHKIGSWKYLSEALFCQFFPEHRMPHFYSPPWTPFNGCWKSAAAAAHDFIFAKGFPGGSVVDNPPAREWQPTPVFLPGEFHGQKSLAGYSPWNHKESDTTEWLTLSFRGKQQVPTASANL